MTNAIDIVLSLILRLIGVAMQAIGLVETFLRGVMDRAGVDSQVQAIVLVAVAVVLILTALRLLGGALRVLIVILLALLLVHILMPGLRIPTIVHV